jgi:Flp pilus assembly protein TadG
MATGKPTRRRLDDRGSVTVEAALVLIAFALFLGLALASVAATIDQLRCVDAAREAARLAARHEPDLALDAATRIAPPDAQITIDTEGEHVTVTIDAMPASGLLPFVALHAVAVGVLEPQGPDG